MRRKIVALVRNPNGLALTWCNWPELPPNAFLAGVFGAEAEKLKTEALPSPTLLLNASFFEEEGLYQIALAEKARFEENVYKSYLLDTRQEITAVFSQDPDRLHRFIQAYGGLFQAKPFCLKRDPRFPVVEDLSISETREGFRLSYLQLAPFDEEKCHLCARCARLCPEGAILPERTIDFRRCNFCRACEEACPEGALNLDRYEEIKEEVRFLLFLEEVPSEVPKRPGLVFTGNELDAFLASLGTFELVESVGINQGKCQYAPRFASGCRLCLSQCPREAISFAEEELVVRHLLCKDCGRCISACPTGALEYTPLDDRGFYSYLNHLPDLSGRTVVIGRESALKRLFWSPDFPEEGDFFFLAHEAPKAFSLEKVLAFFAKGAQRLVFLEKGPQVASLTNDLLEALFGVRPVLVSSMIPPAKPEESLTLKPSALPAYHGRRPWLASLLKSFWQAAGKPKVSFKTQGFGRLKIAPERCTLCLACLNECRQAALAADPSAYALTCEPSLCVACGLCVKICPEGALTLEEGLFLEESFFERTTLAQDEPLVCKRCGKVFGTRKSKEKVEKVLAATGRFAEILDLLDFCDECRVKELFEREV